MRGQLTVESDRLASIANLASELGKDLSGSNYIAGLWQTDIRNGLLWVQKPAVETFKNAKIWSHLLWHMRPYVTQEVADAAHYAGPSWSWVSGTGHISYSLVPGVQAAGLRDQNNSHFEVRNIAIQLMNPHYPCGSVKRGCSIRVVALSLSADATTRDHWGKFELFYDDRPQGVVDRFGRRVFIIVAPWTYNPQGDSRWAGLMIAKSATTGKEVQYLRRGVFLGPECGDRLEQWEQKEFVLI